MATTLTSRTQLLSVTTVTGDTDDFGPDDRQYVFPFPEGNLTDGNTAGKANKFYKAKLTIPASGDVTLVLGDGSLEFEGVPVDFSRIVKFCVYNANTADGDELIVGDAATNPWEGWTITPGGTFTVGPGGLRVFYEPGTDGIPVNGSLSTELQFSNTSTAHAITAYVELVGS